MKETKNNESCCESIGADSSCSSNVCDCGKFFRRSPLKTVICLKEGVTFDRSNSGNGMRQMQQAL